MRGLRGMRGMRGMRGNRGGAPSFAQGPPRRDYGDRHERNFDEAPPRIIEREGQRGGRDGATMRGRGRGEFGGQHMRSRDDFHVAPPRYYNNGDDFEKRGYYNQGPPREAPYYRGGGMMRGQRGGYNNYGAERSYEE